MADSKIESTLAGSVAAVALGTCFGVLYAVRYDWCTGSAVAAAFWLACQILTARRVVRGSDGGPR